MNTTAPTIAQCSVATLMVLTCLLAPASIYAQSWELVWSDEFDYTGLPDTDRWGYDVGGDGWGNSEAQFYTESRAENARVENDVLVIEARKENVGGNAYTSARLVSRGKGDWTYGRIEVRAKLPSGRGTWPAIWMLPTDWIYGDGGWPDNGEIDIMEHVGFDPGRVHGSVHVNAFNHLLGNQKSSVKTVADAETAFHVYAIEWTPGQLDFFIDETVYFRYVNDNRGWTTWPFDHAFHLILNVAVGGTWGGQQGIDDSIFPQRMEVDYVRVYRNAAVPEVTLTSPPAGTTIDTGTPLRITAEASDSDGAVARVEFLQGDGVLGEVTTPPYEWTVDDARPGCYTLTARATDDQGWITRSDTIDVLVGDGCTQSPYLIAPNPIPGVIEAEYFDLGGPGVGYLDVDPANNGGGIRLGEGVDIETTADDGGGYNVGWIATREWLAYTVDVQEAGAYTVEARVAVPGASGAFQLEFDGEDKTGPIRFGTTGGGQTWATVRKEGVLLDAGVQVMRLRFTDNNYKLNKLIFTAETATALEAERLPEAFSLSPSYPNPFNPSTQIAYTVPAASFVTLEVYDTLGRRVATLVARRHRPGRYHVAFDAGALPGGVYFYRMTTPTAQHVRAMTLLR